MGDEGRLLFDAPARSRRRVAWAAGAGSLLALLLFLLGVGEWVDHKVLDTWFAFSGHDASAQVVIVAIDEVSLGVYGPYPWPRDVYVPVIERLRDDGARVIGFDVTFLPNARESAAPSPPAAEGGGPAAAPLSNNQRLAEAMRAAGNVVFGIEFNNVGDPSPPAAPPPDSIQRHSLPRPGDRALPLLPAPELAPSEPLLAEAAAGVGAVNVLPDSDGTIRWLPVVVRHGDRAYPTLGLEMARLYLRKSPREVEIASGRVRLDYAEVPITPLGRVLLNWPGGDALPFKRVSLAVVARGEFVAGTFRDKAVIVAATGKGMDDRKFPGVAGAPGVRAHATFLDNLFTSQHLAEPVWAWGARAALVVVLALLAPLVYPRMGAGRLLLLGGALALALVVASLFLFLTQSAWLRPFHPLAALLLPFAVTIALKLRETERETRDVAPEKLETEELLGLSFQEKGMLDMALATFNKLPLTPGLKAIYLNLGLDFENRGQREKAYATYKRVLEADPGFEDVAARVEALRRLGVGTRLFATTAPDASPTRTQAPPPTAINPAAGATGIDRTADLGGGTRPASARGGDVDATTDLGPGAAPALAPPPPRAAELGRQFGRYEILKKLGRGAMGEVFKVRDPKIGREAAMKTIRVDMDVTPQQAIEMRQRFYREAQTAGKLTHPSIVTIYDVGEEEGISYIVMEYVEGLTLTAYARKQALTPAQIQHVVMQTAAALDYAHSNGVVHRDVKPDNIMISKAGAVKVMDFGIARIVESDMTRTGSILGTPAYMSPEQFSGKKVDGRSDIFSLGVILYELLTGRRPFRGDTPTAVMFEVLQTTPQPPSEVAAGVSPLWDAVLTKALAKDPAQRYATAAEFAEGVRAVHAR